VRGEGKETTPTPVERVLEKKAAPMYHPDLEAVRTTIAARS